MPSDFSQYAADRAAIERSLTEIEEAPPVDSKKRWARVVTLTPLAIGLVMVALFLLAIWI